MSPRCHPLTVGSMLGKTHAASGAAAALAVAPLLNAGPAEVMIGSLVCAGSAVLADIDHPAATVARRLGPLGALLAMGVERVSGGHRKGTHSLLALVLVGLAAWLLPPVGVVVLTAFTAWIGFDLLSRAVGASKIAQLGMLIGAGVGILTYTGVVAPVPWAVVLGYLLHLAGDALTTQRILPLYPFSKHRRFGLPLFDTGSSPETVLRVVLLLGTVALAWFLHLADPVSGLLAGGLPTQETP